MTTEIILLLIQYLSVTVTADVCRSLYIVCPHAPTSVVVKIRDIHSRIASLVAPHRF